MSPQIIYHGTEGLSVSAQQPLPLTTCDTLSLISMGAMGCDWLVAAGQSKLLRPALSLAVNARSLSFHLSPLCFPLPLLAQHSAHLGGGRTGKEEGTAACGGGEGGGTETNVVGNHGEKCRRHIRGMVGGARVVEY